MSDARSPAERLLDVLVFAPAGLVVTAVEEFPKLVEKGKHRVEGQVHAARLVGQFAVQMGRSQIDKAVKQRTSKAPPAPTPVRSVPPTPDSSSGAAPRAGTEGVVGTVTDLHRDGPIAPTPGATPNGAQAPPSLAIPGYDTLSASQVVQRLGGLSGAELEEVRAHELANRHRRTILNRVDQLLGGSDTVAAD